MLLALCAFFINYLGSKNRERIKRDSAWNDGKIFTLSPSILGLVIIENINELNLRDYFFKTRIRVRRAADISTAIFLEITNPL